MAGSIELRQQWERIGRRPPLPGYLSLASTACAPQPPWIVPSCTASVPSLVQGDATVAARAPAPAGAAGRRHALPHALLQRLRPAVGRRHGAPAHGTVEDRADSEARRRYVRRQRAAACGGPAGRGMRRHRALGEARRCGCSQPKRGILSWYSMLPQSLCAILGDTAPAAVADCGGAGAAACRHGHAIPQTGIQRCQHLLTNADTFDFSSLACPPLRGPQAQATARVHPAVARSRCNPLSGHPARRAPEL